ncbi:MAG: DUF4388 domain-containing protein [Candidatus Melainabacteria bacterium]|nr:DUF4388 domain-containing protein [Candidatus Melainabacteria bacterium]
MIEGDLADVSLPGLLQCLATESDKSFRVQLVSGPQKGELIVSEGQILAANFGLLEGNDALTEFLFWGEGAFIVERFDLGEDASFSRSLAIELRQLNTFADQILFLQKTNVGLNTEIVPSPKFGTEEWQEALKKLPLYREDYVVLGWITDGRTMRQAMREFNFDVVQATSSLFRLLSTGSVDCIRPQLVANSEFASALAETAAAEPVVVVDQSSRDKEREKSAKAKAKLDSTSSVSEPIIASQAEEAVKTPEPDLLPDFDMEPEQDLEPEPKPVLAAAKEEVSPVVSNPAPEVVHDFAPPSSGADVITSDSLPAVGSPEFLELMAKAQQVAAVEAVKKADNLAAATSTSVLEKTKAKVVKVDVEPEAEKKSFDIRRTDPLPLVAIDIERLFQTTFHVAPFGQVALNNNALDDDMKKIVSAFKAGKTFINVATDGGHGHDPAQILHTCKYALERGYIDPPDQVVSLTADLLLGRVELEQYLLQRRRLNGDELRDVIEMAKQKGIKLVELLVKMGFMTDSDWDRLNQEKERFAPR